ncbi:MAG: hypothetical protein KC468_20395, partial [Myxococcales bacterium]|nr:hypothetical protein [Myxococcales bacterium]
MKNRRTSMGKRAVVIGGSVSGLLAARVLSEHFENVIVLEKDRLQSRAMKRKGVPQGKHTHLLLRRGADIIQGLFPGLAGKMETWGAFPVNVTRGLRWWHYGVWKARVDVGFDLYVLNRIEFEFKLRKKVKSIHNVELLDSHEAVGLCLDDSGARVVGVFATSRRTKTKERFDADVVIDAAGRGTRAPKWLKKCGFGKPSESEIKVNVGYASCIYRIGPNFRKDQIPLAVFPRAPETSRLGIMYPLSSRGLMVTLSGSGKDYPSRRYAGFMKFAESLERPEFAELLGDARPSPTIHTHQFPSNLWRHYERMRRWPDGYMVVGDGVVSFNPMYGQGMTVCSLEADLLARTLQRLARRGKSMRDPGQTKRLQRRLLPIVIVPWLLASCEDFRSPKATGWRYPGLRLLQWYVAQVHELVAYDKRVVKRFMEVMNFLRFPTALFAPLIVLSVIRHVFRRSFVRALRQASEPILIETAEPASETRATAAVSEETEEAPRRAAGFEWPKRTGTFEWPGGRPEDSRRRTGAITRSDTRRIPRTGSMERRVGTGPFQQVSSGELERTGPVDILRSPAGGTSEPSALERTGKVEIRRVGGEAPARNSLERTGKVELFRPGEPRPEVDAPRPLPTRQSSAARSGAVQSGAVKSGAARSGAVKSGA